jgi:hypothetical protein
VWTKDHLWGEGEGGPNNIYACKNDKIKLNREYSQIKKGDDLSKFIKFIKMMVL